MRHQCLELIPSLPVSCSVPPSSSLEVLIMLFILMMDALKINHHGQRRVASDRFLNAFLHDFLRQPYVIRFEACHVTSPGFWLSDSGPRLSSS